MNFGLHPIATGSFNVLLALMKRRAGPMTSRHGRNVDEQSIDPKLLELQAAKEILGEIFHAGPADIEDMIQGRLAEVTKPESSPNKGLWPATFCLIH